MAGESQGFDRTCQGTALHAKVDDGNEASVMRQICLVFLALLMALASGAEAAKSKVAKPAPVTKPIYEAPMRVVIVRNSMATCEPDCPQWIAAEGEITDATPAQFRKVFKQLGQKKLPVIIRSPGGSINAALIIGKMLRERGMTAAVGYTLYSGCRPDDPACKLPQESKGVYNGMIVEERAFCNSACPMVLAGATTRFSSRDTYIGLHKPRTTWLQEQVRFREVYRMVNGKKKVTSRKIVSRKKVHTKTTYGLDKRLRKRLGDYYKSMGVDIGILVDTEKAEFKDIYFLPEDRKNSLNLRTTGERATFLGNPKLCGDGATQAKCVEDKGQAAKLAVLLVGKPQQAERSGNGTPERMSFYVATLKGSNCATICSQWIAAVGDVAPETPGDFISFVKQAGVGKMAIVLNSAGGDALAAIELGRLIRKFEFETLVGHTTPEPGAKPKHKAVAAGVTSQASCAGSCVLVFAGGKERHVNASPQLVVNHPSFYKARTLVHGIDVKMNIYLSEMGVKPQFMTGLHALKPESTRSLDRAEVLDLKLGTDALGVTDALSHKRCSAHVEAAGCSGPKA
jgi:hypothetical protein